jgi:hypothetical protein
VRAPALLQAGVLAVAGALTVSGCYTLSEPSLDPGGPRDVLSLIVQRGIIATEPLAGETACESDDTAGNVLYLTVRLPDEPEARDLYIHTYRLRNWDESIEEVDACMAEYAAANPGSEIGRLDIPTYRAFGADWSEELTDQLRRVFEEAQHAG